MKPDIRVAFFDVDGTLTINDRSLSIIEKVPASTKKAIQLLIENGIIPVIATGRGRITVEPLAKALGITSIISTNGLSVVFEGKEIDKQFLTTKQVHEIINQSVGKTDLNVCLETTIGPVLGQRADNEFYNYEDFVADIQDDLSKVDDYDIYQVALSGEELTDRVKLHIPGLQAKIVGVGAYDVFPEDRSKATGIAKILEVMDLDKDQAIAFGDEENDMEMFQYVTHTVAMGNAKQELKEQATYITDTVNNDGIYKACLYYQLIKE
jgi:Cof subfamily protein (haloacid dehalogenase superfamily)